MTKLPFRNSPLFNRRNPLMAALIDDAAADIKFLRLLVEASLINFIRDKTIIRCGAGFNRRINRIGHTDGHIPGGILRIHRRQRVAEGGLATARLAPSQRRGSLAQIRSGAELGGQWLADRREQDADS